MIDGFSIHGYRSFSNSGVQIPDLARVNAFIGKNNSGKSNIIRFISLLSEVSQRRARSEVGPKLDPLLDYCLGETQKEIAFGLQVKCGGYTDNIFKSLTEPFDNNWDRLFPENKNSIWLHFKLYPQMEPLQTSLDYLSDLLAEHCDPYLAGR